MLIIPNTLVTYSSLSESDSIGTPDMKNPNRMAEAIASKKNSSLVLQPAFTYVHEFEDRNGVYTGCGVIPSSGKCAENIALSNRYLNKDNAIPIPFNLQKGGLDREIYQFNDVHTGPKIFRGIRSRLKFLFGKADGYPLITMPYNSLICDGCPIGRKECLFQFPGDMEYRDMKKIIERINGRNY